MSLSPFGLSKPRINRRARPVPQEATLNDFSGGLDRSDNDLKLKTNFAKVLDNIDRNVDGTLSVRFGTKFMWDVSDAVAGDMIEIVYFRDKLVCFMDSGEIATIDNAGTITAIWNDTIAALLTGNPNGWSGNLTIIDFTEFRNELIVCNGIDKPIIISSTHTVNYLQDIPTGSNVYTPIGRFVTTVGNFCVIAGVAASPDVIYVSSMGTSGTWEGDSPPNNAMSFNIASYTAATGSVVRGISSFRNYLIVHFADSSVMVELGIFETIGETEVHIPKVLDTMPDTGLTSHRMITVIDHELITGDGRAVSKSKRNVYGNAMETERLSQRVQVDYIASNPDTDAQRLQSFSVYDTTAGKILFFLKQETGFDIYTLAFDEGLKRRAWSIYKDWEWSCGCGSARGRVFFGKGSRVYQLGNEVYEGEDYSADFVGDYDDDWVTATEYVAGEIVRHDGHFYECLTNHTSDDFTVDLEANLWVEYFGEPITFDWELPWTDTNSRMSKKRLSYIGLDTFGKAGFTVSVYTDNFLVDDQSNDAPALSVQFVAGDSPGYGGGDQPYGGGRRAADERLWGFPCEFKIIKLRVRGSSVHRLKIVTVSLLYARGNYNR